MKSALIKETGIHPWEQLNPSADENYISITLLNQAFSGAWETWCEVSSLLKQKWPNIVRWQTNSLPYYSKSQEHTSQKKFHENSRPGDIYRKNESNIYSQITNLNSNPYRTDPNSMTGHRTSVVLMLENNSNLDYLWKKLSNLTDISKIDDFKLILSDENAIYLRFHDSETHGVVQLICHSKHSPSLEKVIKKINLEEIQQEDIYEFIHR